jgi:hypothetical protein
MMTKTKTIEVRPETEGLLTQWASAKKAEREWMEYRRHIESLIAEQYGDEFDAIKGSLSGMSTSVKLGDLEVEFSRDFITDQAEAALLIGLYPNLNGVVLKTEYKPIARGALAALGKPETQLGQELAGVLSFKDVRTYFKG